MSTANKLSDLRKAQTPSLFPGTPNVAFWVRKPGDEEWVTQQSLNDGLVKYEAGVDANLDLSSVLTTATGYALPVVYIQNNATLTINAPTLTEAGFRYASVGLAENGTAGTPGTFNFGSSGNNQTAITYASYAVGPGGTATVYCGSYDNGGGVCSFYHGAASGAGGLVDIIPSGVAPGTTVSIALLMAAGASGSGNTFKIRDAANVVALVFSGITFNDPDSVSSREANLYFTGLGLGQANVDAICDMIIAAVGAAGGAAPQGGVINFSGGTSAVPSGSRVTTLTGFGFTVTTN